MTSSPDACRIRSIPNDVDTNDMKTKEDEEADTTDPITEEMESKTYSLVFDVGTASDEDVSKLSPTMTNECANKTIKKTVENEVSKETFEKFKNGEVITMDLGRQERQDTATGCDNPTVFKTLIFIRVVLRFSK